MLIRKSILSDKPSRKVAVLSGYHTVYQSLEELADKMVDHRECKSIEVNGNIVYYVDLTEYDKKFVFTDIDSYKQDWKKGQIGEWVKTTDNGIALVLDRYIIPNKRYPQHNQPAVRLLTGTFNCNEKYNYESTCFKKRAIGFGRSTNELQKEYFIFGPKHTKFVEDFIYSLIGGEDVWFARYNSYVKNFRVNIIMYNQHSYYKEIVNKKMEYILRHEKAIEIINRILSMSQKKTEILTKYNLTFDKIVQATVSIIDSGNQRSPNFMAALRFGKELIDEAKDEENKQKQLGEEKTPSFGVEDDFQAAEVIQPEQLPEKTATPKIVLEEQDATKANGTVPASGKKSQIFVP